MYDLILIFILMLWFHVDSLVQNWYWCLPGLTQLSAILWYEITQNIHWFVASEK